jgi:glycosyltransferase involved in cell wall biosynthesis
MHGGQWQAVYLIERLCDAKLLTPQDSGLFEEARRRGVEVMPLSFPTLARLARKADLVHAHDARAHTLAAIAGGPPLVVSRRVAFPVKQSLASQWKYSRAALYLAVSRFVAGRLKEAGVAEERVRVVYDGVPLPALTTREQGRVVALAAKSMDVPGIPIHLTTNLWQDLSTASIFVYVSNLEGLGSGVLAAMAAGVPVVACGAGGIQEAVEHEHRGLLVERDEIARAIQRLLDDPQAAEQMGMRGRKRVEELFTVDAMVSATRRAYDELAKGDRCGKSEID